MQEIERFIAKDFFARHLGIEVLEYSPGKARAKMEITSHHLNSAGILHGGATFALADTVFAVASNSHGTLAVAINASVSFFKAVRSGVIFAEAEEVSLNPKLATYLITVKDDRDETIALFQGTVYRKKERLSDLLGL
ncbi:MAG TPA: PaaI family thioesterase [Thermodesulfovibrionales bacterium]|nr:PaaI family thioesterase [Thermodesulfovibrionales bacterium]